MRERYARGSTSCPCLPPQLGAGRLRVAAAVSRGRTFEYTRVSRPATVCSVILFFSRPLSFLEGTRNNRCVRTNSYRTVSGVTVLLPTTIARVCLGVQFAK